MFSRIRTKPGRSVNDVAVMIVRCYAEVKRGGGGRANILLKQIACEYQRNFGENWATNTVANKYRKNMSHLKMCGPHWAPVVGFDQSWAPIVICDQC